MIQHLSYSQPLINARSQSSVLWITTLISVIFGVIAGMILIVLHFTCRFQCIGNPDWFHQYVNIPKEDVNRNATLLPARYSYNLCKHNGRFYDDPTSVMMYKSGDNNNDLNLFIHEVMYDDLAGMFVFLLTSYSTHMNRPSPHADYYHDYNMLYNSELSTLHSKMACWNSLDQMAVPISNQFVRQVAFAEVRCPFMKFPQHPAQSIPSSSTTPFEMALLINYEGEFLIPHTPVTHVTSKSKHSVVLNVCVEQVQQPALFSFASNGIQGENLGPSLIDFIYYNKAIGVDKFMIFDDSPRDQTCLQTLEPLIKKGWVDYYYAPILFHGQQQGFLQDVLMGIAKFRYYYKARHLLFLDIDEFVVFSQEHYDQTYEHYKQTKGTSHGLQPIQFMDRLDQYLQDRTQPFPNYMNEMMVRIQNLPQSKQSYVVSVVLQECLALFKETDKDVSSGSMIDKFKTCNVAYENSKWLSSFQSHCALTNHFPNCNGLTIHDQKDKFGVFILHFFNAIKDRRAFQPNQHPKLYIQSIERLVNFSKVYFQ